MSLDCCSEFNVPLEGKDIVGIWRGYRGFRGYVKVRREYYEGCQAILRKRRKSPNDPEPNRHVTNWVKFAAESHGGFQFGRPLSVTLKEDPSEFPGIRSLFFSLLKKLRAGAAAIFPTAFTSERVAGLRAYEALRDSLSLNALDAEHFQRALLYGYSVEVHGFDGKSPTIRGYDPSEWAFSFDSSGEIRVAIHVSVIAKGTWEDGGLVDNARAVWTVYEGNTKRVFHSKIWSNKSVIEGDYHPSCSARNFTEFYDCVAPKLEEQGDVQELQYSKIPVVLFSVTPAKSSWFTDAAIDQQDHYNDVRSMAGDDVWYNLNAFLALHGYSGEEILKKDPETGQSMLDRMRANRLVTLDTGGKAEFLTKGNEVEKWRYETDETRDAIHMMLSFPDTHKVTGITGATSGTALQIRFAPQVIASATFSVYFEVGFRSRVDLLNETATKLENPTLESYDVTFSREVPVNEAEIAGNIPHLKTVMAPVDILRQLPSVENPEEYAARFEVWRAQELLLAAVQEEPTPPQEEPTPPQED